MTELKIEFLDDKARHRIGALSGIRSIIRHIGDDPDREGLRETPERAIRSYEELFSGYTEKVDVQLTSFEDDCDEMVVLRDIDFASFCEHHLMPFTGRAHIAYIPNGRVVGISKLARVLEVFTRRLQIQERITHQVTAALDEYLKPKGSACVLEGTHTCMTCRGVLKKKSVMVTSSLTGDFREGKCRQEFLSLVRGH